MLWADRISTKESIGTSPFQLVYGIDAVLPIQLGLLVMKFLQDTVEDTNDIQRRIYHLVKIKQTRDQLSEKE